MESKENNKPIAAEAKPIFSEYEIHWEYINTGKDKYDVMILNAAIMLLEYEIENRK